MLEDTFTIDPLGLEPCPVNLFIKLTKDLDIQIRTGQDFAITLNVNMHCRDLFSASWRWIESLRQITIV